MNRHRLVLAGGVLIAGVLMLTGFGVTYDIYTDMQNCQQMDAQPNVTANCWSFPTKFFVAGGLVVGLGGVGLLATSTRWYRNHAEHPPA